MAQRSELAEQDGGEFEALGLDLPELLLGQLADSLRDFDHCFSILAGNSGEYVEGVDTDVDAVVREADQGVVEEHVEPLLVEFFLLREDMRLARVHQLVVVEVLLELLNDFDAKLEVVSAMGIDQLADLLALVWALLDKTTVVPEEVLREEFVELVAWSVLVLIDLNRELLAEHESVGEGALDRREASEHHGQEGVESGNFSA